MSPSHFPKKILLLFIVTGQLKRFFYGKRFISFYASAGSQVTCYQRVGGRGKSRPCSAGWLVSFSFFFLVGVVFFFDKISVFSWGRIFSHKILV